MLRKLLCVVLLLPLREFKVNQIKKSLFFAEQASIKILKNQ